MNAKGMTAVSWGIGTALGLLGGSAALPQISVDAKAAAPSAAVQRGEYIVRTSGCHDCHTPWKMGANGPEPDMSRMLSGHPEAMKVSAPPRLEAPWMAAASATFTAWAGPWGISFSPNLTPDTDTGLGSWTERQFVDALRSGRHQGHGRPILPPMPWQGYANLSDADLAAVFAYLRSIPAIENRAPDPVIAATEAK